MDKAQTALLNFWWQRESRIWNIGAIIPRIYLGSLVTLRIDFGRENTLTNNDYPQFKLLIYITVNLLVIRKSHSFLESIKIPDFNGAIMRACGKGLLTGMHSKRINRISMSLVYNFDGLNLIEEKIVLFCNDMMSGFHI